MIKTRKTVSNNNPHTQKALEGKNKSWKTKFIGLEQEGKFRVGKTNNQNLFFFF